MGTMKKVHSATASRPNGCFFFRMWQVAHRILSLAAEYMELVGRFPTQMVSIKGVSRPNSRLKITRECAAVIS